MKTSNRMAVLVLVSACTPSVECGPGTHLEGALCVADQRPDIGVTVTDGGLPLTDGGVPQSDGGWLTVHVATDWTAMMDFADGAAVLDLQTGERTDLGVSWSDGRVRIVDETGVHDFGAQASARAVLRLPVWGRQETQLLFKTVGNTQALELWHAPSGRHVRVSNQVFATPYEHLCGPDLVRGVGADHPGLYSFVEPAPEGDGTGEFFVGEADLLTPPRSLGKVKLASCRKPRASLDGVSVGFMELDSAASKLTRARLRQVTAA